MPSFRGMSFLNDKKTFLTKLDKSKKGEVDAFAIPLLNLINSKPDYYSTSSCSGRVYLWQGTGKKNEITWLKVSHDLIAAEFLYLTTSSRLSSGLSSDLSSELVWLRLESCIFHVACQNLSAANALLEAVRRVCKKSCLLSIQNKFIVEIRGSEFVEMPLYQDGKLVYSGDLNWLVEYLNSHLKKSWQRMSKLKEVIPLL